MTFWLKKHASLNVPGQISAKDLILLRKVGEDFYIFIRSITVCVKLPSETRKHGKWESF